MFGAEFTHPCFSGALEVRFDFGLCFVGQVHGDDRLRLECQCCCRFLVREDEVSPAIQIGMATCGLLPAVKDNFTTA